MVDTKLEVLVLPVSDVDRAKDFYGRLGWRLDADVALEDGFKLVQYTPPGSQCSVHFGTDLTSAAPGSAKGMHLVVADAAAAREALAAAGADVSEIFHEGTVGDRFHADRRVAGPGSSYGSFVAFSDPDGNEWLVQEVTTRLPGRVDTETAYASAPELAEALRRAAAAHGEHEKRTGEADENWPDWYAEFMVKEQSGEELPQ
jgi:catechol 2,3-dioxygenase-like lactoylglutathione lyase family enzyme